MKKVTLFLSTIVLATLATSAGFAEDSAAKQEAGKILPLMEGLSMFVAQPNAKSETCYILGVYGTYSSMERSMLAGSTDTKLVEVVVQFNDSFNRMAGFCGFNNGGAGTAVTKDDVAGLNAEIATLTKYLNAIP